MGLATHGFHDSFDKLPPNRLVDGWASFFVFILPYVEQQSLYDQWNLHERFTSQSVEARTTVLDTFVCPSRPHEHLNSPDNNAALGDYTPVTGSKHLGGGANLDKRDGPIIGYWVHHLSDGHSWDSHTSFRSILDGLSNTALIGEEGFRFAQRTGIFNGDHGAVGLLGPTRIIGRAADRHREFDFQGPHPAVCQFVFCDGSVHALRVEISVTIQGRLANRADGEPIPDFDS
jgi:hypothetical protein